MTASPARKKSAAEFRALCIELFGKHGWQSACSRFLIRDDGTHVSVRTVRRWGKGDSPVPIGVMELLRAERVRRVG